MTDGQILVTSALPYANGQIHIGHLMEYVQTDIWVRFQKLSGRRCVYICADDTHGTPIMMRARQEQRSEESLIAEMGEHHRRDFAAFDIGFDNYGSTNSAENRELCAQIWQALRGANLIIEREITQLFDPIAGVFLADRFVKGTCPVCKRQDQYGDNCECGATYQATDLIDPVSTLSGSKPEQRQTRQLFVELEQLHLFLQEWTQSGRHLQQEVANYLKGHFLHEPLRDWDVSRPAPYFGFEIPDSPGNYWYVWFDAPIGYIASTKEWCDRNGEHLDDWWRSEQTEIHHFIGKDIQYFHTLFWPAMLDTAGFQLPTQIHIHGFLTVDGRKMSKRDGTFISAATYLRHLDPSYFRYYLASKLGPRLDDLDLNFDEFCAKVNSDLVGKVVNLASRSAKFVETTGLSPRYPDDGGLFQYASEMGSVIAAAYAGLDFNRAMRLIMELADRANAYVDAQVPWVLKKDPQQATKLQDVCTVTLNLFRQLSIYLAPVLPRLAQQTEHLLNRPLFCWDDAKTPLIGSSVAKFEHMLKRVDRKDVEAMIEETKQDTPRPESLTPGIPAPGIPAPESQASVSDSDAPLKAEPLASVCTIDDFAKVDLRVARVVVAEDVPDARKLLKLTVSLGGDERRTVFAGIKEAYSPEKLVGRLVIVVANLQPRQMKFGVSEGMIVACGPGGKDVYLLDVEDGAQVGQRVH